MEHTLCPGYGSVPAIRGTQVCWDQFYARQQAAQLINTCSVAQAAHRASYPETLLQQLLGYP